MLAVAGELRDLPSGEHGIQVFQQIAISCLPADFPV